jgi:hypothetical protein
MSETQKGVMLDRAALGAVAFVGDAASYRPQMAGLHVKADGTVQATNGHYLAVIPPCQMPPEDFPEVAGMAANPIPDAGITIPADAVKATSAWEAYRAKRRAEYEEWAKRTAAAKVSA